LVKVVLTGITSVFGPTRAFVEITEQEPGKTPNVKKPIMREGDREGSIEVISIDVVNNSVRIKNGGIETNVVFEVAKSSIGPTPGPGGPPTALPMGALQQGHPVLLLRPAHQLSFLPAAPQQPVAPALRCRFLEARALPFHQRLRIRELPT